MMRIALGITAVLSVGLMAGCSSGTTDTPPATTAPTTNALTAPTSLPTAVATTAPSVEVSGTWKGSYNGVYSGTFTLTWQQTGSTVNGNIDLSSPQRSFGINGNLAGSAITFGSVSFVTYSGTVSGNSMQGTYSTPTGGNGNWTANKS
jgi:hypothetical protein